MRQFNLWKSFIGLACVGVLAGVAMGGWRARPEVRQAMRVTAAWVETAAPVPRLAADEPGDTTPVGELFGALTETYTHPELGFSFQYPRGFLVSERPQGDGEEVLVEDPTRERHGFQVFVMPFDEDGPLTEARIRQGVPDILMEQPAPVQVAGVAGVSFVHWQHPSVGKTYEVWFVHEGTLYEVATYADRAAALQDILSTWTFYY